MMNKYKFRLLIYDKKFIQIKCLKKFIFIFIKTHIFQVYILIKKFEINCFIIKY